MAASEPVDKRCTRRTWCCMPDLFSPPEPGAGSFDSWRTVILYPRIHSRALSKEARNDLLCRLFYLDMMDGALHGLVWERIIADTAGDLKRFTCTCYMHMHMRTHARAFERAGRGPACAHERVRAGVRLVPHVPSLKLQPSHCDSISPTHPAPTPTSGSGRRALASATLSP